MNTFGRTTVVGLLLAQAVLLAVGGARHSPVINEPAHLAAGISHWKLDRFDLYRVNPPLVRLIAALPVLAVPAETDWASYSKGVGLRQEFVVMGDFVRINGSRVTWLVTLARCALIPIMLFGGYVCYRWARELYGHAAGIMALVLWCFCPNLLAYGQVINADAGATALGVAATYFFWKWLRDPAWDRALLAGIVLGLAELTKTTWVVLFGLWPMLWLVWRGQWLVDSGQWLVIGWLRRFVRSKTVNGNSHRPHPSPLPEGEGEKAIAKCPAMCRRQSGQIANCKLWGNQALQLATILGLAVLVINAGYDFEDSGMRLRNFVFTSRPLTGASEGQAVGFGNRFAKSWLGGVPLPLPRNYVEGIDMQWHDIEVGKPSYLRGRWKERGWWYWYLYALAVKVPLGTWGLLVLAAGVRVARTIAKCKIQNAKCKMEEDGRNGTESVPYRTTWRDEVVLLAPAVVVLVLVSSQTGFSRYIRYVLPIFPFVFIWISSLGRFLGVRRFIATFRRRGVMLTYVDKRGTTSTNEGGSAAEESGDESPHSITEALTPALSQRERENKAHATVGVVTTVFLMWSVGSSLWNAPHWMSYFNELAGGPMGGPAHLIDAQVDWGQDLHYLKKWLDGHPEAKPLGLVYFGPINPRLAGVDFVLPPKGTVVTDDRGDIASVPGQLEPGWYAVSVNHLYGYPHYLHNEGGGRVWADRPYYSYFRRFQPVATAGYSIYIYYVTARDIEAALTEASE